jgi:hypothetical protein
MNLGESLTWRAGEGFWIENRFASEEEGVKDRSKPTI